MPDDHRTSDNRPHPQPHPQSHPLPTEGLRELVHGSLEWCRGRLDQAVVARVMSTSGFGGRRSGEVMIVGERHVMGSLASGAANAAVVEAARALLNKNVATVSAQTIDVPVGDFDAVKAGLACGGTLHVLLQRLDTFGQDTVELIVTGGDLVLVTDPGTGRTVAIADMRADVPADGPAGAVVSLGPRRVAGAPEPADGQWPAAITAAARMLTKGPTSTIMVGDGPEALLVQAVTSTPRVLVFGRAALADAIGRVASVLGWTATVFDESTVSAAVAAAGDALPQDGVVVLSHDIEASCAVLAAALANRCGYVGALGSRHTQQARRRHLVEHLQVTTAAADTVRGPVGLDLGARSPEETALAIVAEMLAVVRHRSAVSLVSGNGPING